MSLDPSDTSAIRLGITSAAVAGDAGALYRLATGLMEEGVPFDSLLFDHLLPAERAVGERWQQGDVLISEEHAATAAIETLISLLVGMFDQPTAGTTVVIAAAEGDDHSLPGRAISAHLLYSGYRTTFLGGNVLATDLAEFLETDRPDILVLSCTLSSHLVGAHASVLAAKRSGIPVVVGGRAFGENPRRARAIGAEGWSETLPGVLDEVDAVLRSGRREPPVPLSGDLVSLRTEEVDVLSRAHQDLRRHLESTADKRWIDELSILLGAVEGVMLTGDPELLVETMRWQQVTLTAHGYAPDLVSQALLTALRHHSEPAAEILERGLGALQEA